MLLNFRAIPFEISWLRISRGQDPFRTLPGRFCFCAENPENNAPRLLGGVSRLSNTTDLLSLTISLEKNKLLIFNISSHDFSFLQLELFFFLPPAEMTNVGGRCYRPLLQARSNLPCGSWLQVETCRRVGSRLSGTSSRRCFLPLRMYQRWFFAFLFLCNLHRISVVVDLSLELLLLFLLFTPAPAASTSLKLGCGIFRLRDKPFEINKAMVSNAAALGFWSDFLVSSRPAYWQQCSACTVTHSQNKQVQARPQ